MTINNPQVLNLIYSIIIIIFIYIVKTLILRFSHKHIPDKLLYYKAKRIINGISFFLFVILMAIIWVHKSDSLITYLGLFSAGLALALRDILLNTAGWMYILIRQPFAVGDRIEIEGIKGDVIDQNLFKFRVIEVGNWVHADQSTGRIIHIPNAKIFTTSLANYTLGFEYIWDEIRVLVTFESDWRKAKEILTDIVNEYSENIEEEMKREIHETSRKYMIYYRNLTPIVYTAVVESGVELSMRFMCEPRKRRNIEEVIWEAVLNAFEKEKNIEIAYPTMRRVQK